jgi:RNA polymerase sigma-70 factor (ECF subfamily)
VEPASVSDAEDLSRRWRPALMAFFRRRVRNSNEAEDLVHEVFVRMLQQRKSATPDVYIFQIARNLLVDRIRKDRVRDRYREGLAAEPNRDHDGFDPHRLAEGREQLTLLTKAMGDLPERTRAIFILYRVENMSQDAIASAFGISTSAVKQHVAKAMALLLREMRDVR